MLGPSTNPKLSVGAPFASWGAKKVRLGRMERKELARFPSRHGIRGPLVFPSALAPPATRPRCPDSTALPSEPSRYTRTGQIARNTQPEHFSLGAAETPTTTTGHSMSPTIRHLSRSTPSKNLAPATWSRKTRSSGDMEAPTNPLSLEPFSRKEVKADGAIVVREKADVVCLV